MHPNYFSGSQDLASQLSSMLENQKIESVKPKEKSKEEIERKAAILAAYSQVSDEEYPLLILTKNTAALKKETSETSKCNYMVKT